MHKQLKTWMTYEAQLRAFKKYELDARLAAIEDAFKPLGLVKDEGTTHLIDDGHDFKATFRMNYKIIDEARLAKFLLSLPEEIRPLLIKQVPTLQIGMYRKLDNKARAKLNACLSITSGTPALTHEPT